MAAWREESCGSHTSAYLMSWVYWGIVVGLLAMVATMLLCVGFLSPKARESAPASGDKLDEAGAAVGQDSGGYRRAA